MLICIYINNIPLQIVAYFVIKIIIILLVLELVRAIRASQFLFLKSRVLRGGSATSLRPRGGDTK